MNPTLPAQSQIHAQPTTATKGILPSACGPGKTKCSCAFGTSCCDTGRACTCNFGFPGCSN